MTVQLSLSVSNRLQEHITKGLNCHLHRFLKRHETADPVVPNSKSKSTSCLSLLNLHEKAWLRHVKWQQAAPLALSAVGVTETNQTQATNRHN